MRTNAESGLCLAAWQVLLGRLFTGGRGWQKSVGRLGLVKVFLGEVVGRTGRPAHARTQPAPRVFFFVR